MRPVAAIAVPCIIELRRIDQRSSCTVARGRQFNRAIKIRSLRCFKLASRRGGATRAGMRLPISAISCGRTNVLSLTTMPWRAGNCPARGPEPQIGIDTGFRHVFQRFANSLLTPVRTQSRRPRARWSQPHHQDFWDDRFPLTQVRR